LRLFGAGHFAACHFPLQAPVERAEDVSTVVV
jgi:hypothetical protein